MPNKQKVFEIKKAKTCTVFAAALKEDFSIIILHFRSIVIRDYQRLMFTAIGS